MSLNWQWADKMGEVIFQDYDPEHPFKTSIYQGNALMIWVNESRTTPTQLAVSSATRSTCGICWASTRRRATAARTC